MMEIVQNIHIKRFTDGSFSVEHKHSGFQPEAYVVKSKTGIPAVIRNLTNGFLPDIRDLYAVEGSEPTTALEMASKAKRID